MKLMEKLLEIQKSATYVQKNAQGYQYKYASGTDVIAPIRKKMDELSLLLIPSFTETTHERGEMVADGGKVKIQFFTAARLNFRWLDVESGEALDVPWYGQGVDPAEKGVGKLLTYAERYFLLKFFHIATDSDDPDRFQERLTQAGKRTRKGGLIPPQAPPPMEPPPNMEEGWIPPPDPPQGNGSGLPVTYPQNKRNPYAAKVIAVHPPTSGNTGGRPWTRWEIEMDGLNLSTFNENVAQVCRVALAEGRDVEVIWKLKKSARTGIELCTAEEAMIIE